MRLSIPFALVSAVLSLHGCNGFTVSTHGANNVYGSFTTTTATFSGSNDYRTTSRNMVFDVTDEEKPSAQPYMVDMNQYNLPLDEVAQEWTAELVPESSLREEGIYLGAKSKKDVFVDSFKVEIPRKVGQGLGIGLLEIAGGREDGLGITVVDGIVEGGCADDENIDIQVGDSIAKVAVIRKTQTTSGSDGLTDKIEEVVSIGTECYGYDMTVDAIVSLPPPPPAEEDSDIEEYIVLTMKRLRRRPKVTVKLQYPPSQNEPDATIELFAGENLRRAMLTRGVKLNDPLSLRFDSGGTGDCGAEGTCATCVVSIIRGQELLNSPGIQEEQILVKNPRWRFACRAVVGHGMQEGEMLIRVNPRQWAD